MSATDLATEDQKLAVTGLLIRLTEPNVTPKNNIVYEMPSSVLQSRYQDVQFDLEPRLGEAAPQQKVIVKSTQLPDISYAKLLDRNAMFSVFNTRHKAYAAFLIQLFIDCKNIDELITVGLYVRDQVNPYMFAYCYSVAIYHRKDTHNINIPALPEIFPAKFVPKDVLHKCREEAFVVPNHLRKAVHIDFNFTASNLYPEQRCAYFREDLGINAHHWHWHLVYPAMGPNAVVNKDRRGELFYYMHNQVLARYNMARKCEGLKSVEPLLDLRAPIRDGYYSKLNSAIATRGIPGRSDNAVISNLGYSADMGIFPISTCETWLERIIQAIDLGQITDANGTQISLNNNKGIDHIGNMLESTQLSPNQGFYGNFHNMGHVQIAQIHNPDSKYLEQAGVMSDTTTAMRDIVFYKWHALIDFVCSMHKTQRPPYTVPELTMPNVTVQQVQLIMNNKYTNELETFFQRSEVNLANGMDFTGAGPILVKFLHLNYKHFTYKITVNNAGPPVRATLRTFLIPTLNDALELAGYEQWRQIAAEMDKTTVLLRTGVNKIIRKSTESSVTIPFERTFTNKPLTNPPAPAQPGQTIPPRPQPTIEESYCACGWPQHMLLPKGTPEGYRCHLFVMFTDYESDKAQDDNTGMCSESLSFCGIRDKLYPDKKPMGFPFDRPSWDSETPDNFVAKAPNMFLRTLTIKHDPKLPDLNKTRDDADTDNNNSGGSSSKESTPSSSSENYS